MTKLRSAACRQMRTLNRCEIFCPPCRVGHLFSAYHALACLCRTLGVNLSAALAHPSRPLADASLAAAAPAQLRTGVADERTHSAAAAPGPASTQAHPVAAAPNAGGDVRGGAGSSSSSSAGAGALAAECLSREGAGTGAASEMDVQEGQPGEEEEQGEGEADEKIPQEAGSPAAPVQENGLGSGTVALPPTGAAALEATQLPSAGPQPAPSSSPCPVGSSAAVQPQAEPAIGAALRPFGAAIDELVAAISDAAQLRAWPFVLEYREVGAGGGVLVVTGCLASWGCEVAATCAVWRRMRLELLYWK